MEAAGGDLGWMNLLLAGVLCVMALLWCWMAGRMGWHWFISAMVILSGVVLLTGATVAWQANANAFLFVPKGDMTHAAGVALMVIGINAALAAAIWLVVLIGLRALGAAQRRRV